MNNPFFNTETQTIDFPFSGFRDVVFIYPHELPEDIRGILIPDKYKEFHQYSAGVILAVGEGYYDSKKGNWCPTSGKVGDVVLFDASIKEINWKIKVKSPVDGKDYICFYMGELDCQAMVEI